MTNEVAVVALPDVERMAKYAVESGLFGVKTVPQAISLMLLCQAKGMHPMEAMEEYHIIQGRHTMKAERMLAKFQAAGGKVAWKELGDTRAEATFSHPQGGSVTIDWDIERAKRAGIAGKDNWKNYPRSMLRSRVVSEGITAVLPGVKGSAMTPEEAIDIPETTERDVTPQKPATGVAALQARLADLVPPASEFISATEAVDLATLCDDNGIPVAKLLAAAQVESLEKIKILDRPRAIAWIDAAIERKRAKASPDTGELLPAA